MDEADATNVTRFGLLGVKREHPFPLTVEQQQTLGDLERTLDACSEQEAKLVILRIREFWRVANENYAVELNAQYLNVMLHAPSANEEDEVLAAFLSKNPLITKVELFRLLIRSTRSARATFSNQKKKRSTADKVGGQSTPKSQAAFELKKWVDGEVFKVEYGGVRATARRLATRAPRKFYNILDDVQRVIEDHLRSNIDKDKVL